MKQAVPRSRVQQHTGAVDDLSEWLHDIDMDMQQDNNRRRWILAKYNLVNMDPLEMLRKMSHSFKVHCSTNIRHICIGTTDTPNDNSEVPVLALIRKHDTKYLVMNEFAIDGVLPTSIHAVKFPGKTQIGIVSFFRQFSGALHRFATTMELEPLNDDGYTLEHLHHYTKSMTNPQLCQFIADCVLVPKKKRNLFQISMIASKQALLDKRAAERPVVRNVFDASNVKNHVQPRSAFSHAVFDLPMQVLDTSLLANSDENTTLRSYMDNWDIHQNISLLLLGATRCGKTELAKFISAYLSMKYKGNKFSIVFTNSLDVLKNYQSDMTSGAWVILDEMEPWSEQLVHSTATTWKTILQCKDPASSRARHADVEWSSRMGKVITSNCKTFEEWLGPVARGEHARAIQMRLAVVAIPDGFTVWSGPAPINASSSMLQPVLDAAALDDAINDILQ